ncbi:glycoside hydrolase family 2 TIM barrel-domain containing protein [Kribbella sp. NPDC005582]|uniref:glycoside hydrolase family 2 TIM barrel-domain containing protein n=1 Tax=Kribbella sp. NPDC005582 TaxID=3156893 RepID=UPI0033B48079
MTLQRRHFLALGATGAAGLALPQTAAVAAARGGNVDTELFRLSGEDRDQPVEWEFMVTSGRRSGVWSTIPTPSNWEFHGFGTYNYGWNLVPDEKGLYRHSFTPPGSWRGRRSHLVFEGSMTDTAVWLNGQSAGPVHQGGFYRFSYDVTDKLLPGRPNRLEVTVTKDSTDASVNRAERLGDYWNFGGIYRPVYLRSVPLESVERLAVDARADGSFTVDVYVDGLIEAARVVAQIRSLDGAPVGRPFTAEIEAGGTKTTLRTGIVKARPWTAETPNRYQVEVQLVRNRKILHRTTERFGFRTVEVRPGDGIYVNGAKVVLKGANRHTSWPTSGRTSSEKLSRDDIMLMKSMNMNAVRMSHYPPDTHFLDLCDELGLYVLDELAGWQKKYDEGVATPLVKSMVTRDVNHPSILFWDNGNEGGWNTALDDDFALYDPQQRKVLHPWANFNGINTDHYESYESTKRILDGPDIFMPTEFLHGLYDGGAGAGLDDYWKLMGNHPRSAGGFLWALADEGVVRDDLGGVMDVAGNAAPDGIVGPFREKEASYYTVRDVWSPIQLMAPSTDGLPADFAGRITIANGYAFTNTRSCRFSWSLADFAAPVGGRTSSTVRASGTVHGPDLGPGETGTVKLDLPLNWRRFDALTVIVHDPAGLAIVTWRWVISKAADRAKRVVRREGRGEVAATMAGDMVVMQAGGTEVGIDATTGRLAQVHVRDDAVSLANGPALATGSATLSELTHGRAGSAYFVEAQYSGDLSTVRWCLYPSGWLRLDYRYELSGVHQFFGVDFDYPQDSMENLTWLGQGPYRVWQNRRRGLLVDVWSKDYNDTATGASGWNYPEFKGYHANLSWAVLRTTEGTITMVTENEDLFLRVGTPKAGPDPRFTSPPFPAGDLSFLDAIPAIGTKFDPPTALGPQSQPAVAQGPYQRTVHFTFGPSAGARFSSGNSR